MDTRKETLWNGRAGAAWVAAQALLDRLYQPIEQHRIIQNSAAVANFGAGRGWRLIVQSWVPGPSGHVEDGSGRVTVAIGAVEADNDRVAALAAAASDCAGVKGGLVTDIPAAAAAIRSAHFRFRQRRTSRVRRYAPVRHGGPHHFA